MESFILAFGLDKDGGLHNGHFGDAYKFVFFRFYSGGRAEFCRECVNTKRQEDESTEHGSSVKLSGVKGILKECDCVAANIMSPNFKKMAENSAVQPVVIKTKEKGEFLNTACKNCGILFELACSRRDGKREGNVPVFRPAAQ